ncbi:uncharacterized protein N7496_004667 [Penicillium cataractarum]|uniref:Alpha-L-rhamnosidase six-hairpin glycosidase domain-containing protein n=1 Tax=Penicillium cataractarum TaxID=2100454 RepID=A0A9W9VCP8_9EURO|nr:uncharacterized protein N7496_004667 [Penicillium cataractarum]KAJ5377258.1 hypothetical protein N7496_004667 [Penicillium cataractarum]
MSATFDRTWIWHPAFPENQPDTAGLLVHFRRQFTLGIESPKSLKIHISADTRYKLYVNQQLVSFGPVKGDQSMWFYDEVDIGPFLRTGENHVAVHVLRIFYATQFAPSFPRLPSGGLRVLVPVDEGEYSELLRTSEQWESAIDPFASLRVDEPEDVFLHTYESHQRQHAESPLDWKPAKRCAARDVARCAPGRTPEQGRGADVCLAPGSCHQFELEVAAHTTAFLRVRFLRPTSGGSSIRLTYAESYEDEPDLYVGVRRKAHRRDMTKQLIGPHDSYQLQGPTKGIGPGYFADEEVTEVFAPFHYRTFRFIKIDIAVEGAELVFQGIDVDSCHYPLDVQAQITAGPGNATVDSLWTTSLRTLVNCMHDCYEDCPFYEQLQYAMDTRSSALFTYCVSGDDRLARQAIIQLYNSFQPRLGLTASRAPSHRQQFIPHFSLYWIRLLSDHLEYFDDHVFLSRFLAVVDAILTSFAARIDPHLGLVKWDIRPGIWNYVDWTTQWKPYGCPPVCERTGFSTFTNEIYAYALSAAATLAGALQRPAVADEYRERARHIAVAVRKHCFDGEFFTDSLVSAQADDMLTPRSQHSQVWAVLGGVVRGAEAQELLRKSIRQTKAGSFVQESVAMSFYTLRALSLAGGSLYDDHFHAFWEPWRSQLAMGVTTWVEDGDAQRSDCHAWGSAPLYEFTAEVAGVRPAAAGWKAIQVRPRINLYTELDARLPLRMVDGKISGMVYVSWARGATTTDVRVRIKVEMRNAARPVPVHIYLPGQEIVLEVEGSEVCFSTNL